MAASTLSPRTLVQRLTRLNTALLAGSLIVLLVLPSLVSPALVAVIATANCYVIFAASWDLLTGYTGQVNFGHAAFIGTGGFTVGLLSKYADGVPAELQLVTATLVAALLGVAIGVPCLRLRGPYLALATLSAASALFQLSFVYKRQTGGEEGISGVARLRDADLLGPIGKALASIFTFGRYDGARRLEQSAYINYYVTLVVMLCVLAYLVRLGYGARGLVLRSIQQDETAAEAAGVPVVRYKLVAFVISGGLAGLGGALLVQVRGSAGIDLLLVTLSLLVIIIAAIGGAGTIIGPAVGAYIVILLQNYYLDRISLFDSHPELKPGLFALALIVLLIVQPRGLVPPLLAKLRARGR